jgi:hypothetical protein
MTTLKKIVPNRNGESTIPSKEIVSHRNGTPMTKTNEIAYSVS